MHASGDKKAHYGNEITDENVVWYLEMKAAQERVKGEMKKGQEEMKMEIKTLQEMKADIKETVKPEKKCFQTEIKEKVMTKVQRFKKKLERCRKHKCRSKA